MNHALWIGHYRVWNKTSNLTCIYNVSIQLKHQAEMKLEMWFSDINAPKAISGLCGMGVPFLRGRSFFTSQICSKAPKQNAMVCTHMH